jgi:hypothetical protein
VGEDTHQQHLLRKGYSIKKFIKHSEGIMNKRLYMGVFDSMLVKYGAFMVGMEYHPHLLNEIGPRRSRTRPLRIQVIDKHAPEFL